MDLQRINVDHFRHRPVRELAALLPDVRAVEASAEALSAAGTDISQVRVLEGEQGVRILDRSGAAHGFLTTLVRFLQSLGFDQSFLAVYDEGLRKGQALMTVPCTRAEAQRVSEVLLVHGAHGVVYFGSASAETLSPP